MGPGLNARDTGRQITETKIATKVLNRMTDLGRAIYERVA
jgi:hypothetical protein